MVDWFRWSYCINLATRPDRWKGSFICARQVGIYLTRFKATSASEVGDFSWLDSGVSADRARAKIATTRSHRGVIGQALVRGLPYVAIFEDDVVFVENFRERWARAELSIPSWAGLIVIGGRNGTKRDRESYGTVRSKRHVAGSWWQPAHLRCRHAYIVRRHLYPALLAVWSDETIEGDVGWNRLLDHLILHQPMLVSQRSGYSDIEGRHVDYTTFFGTKWV